MAEEKDRKAGESGSRWWEFYAVRYAMGTVVGAVMVYFVLSLTPSLRPLLFEGAALKEVALAPLKQLDNVQLTVLAVSGLVYCYVASGPILVLHAARFLLATGIKLSRPWMWFAIMVVPSIFAGLLFWLREPKGPLALVFACLAGGVLSVISLQYIAVVLTLRHRKEMFAFYVRLSAARTKSEGGITDSYRHLREHGNSFFILLLEILLGVLLVAVGTTNIQGVAEVRPATFLLVLVLWIIPPVLVWAAGTLFELEFSNGGGAQSVLPASAAQTSASGSSAVVGSQVP